MKKNIVIPAFCNALFLFCFLFNTVGFKKDAPPKNDVTGSNTTVAIDVKTPQIQIPDDFLGLSYEVTGLTDTLLFRSNHKVLLNLMNGLGKGIIRLGGYYADNHFWCGHRRMYNTKDSIATSDIDSLVSFMHKTQWRVILDLNLIKPDSNYAEVRYALRKGADVISAFEIGNEPEVYHKGFRSANYGVADYTKEITNACNDLKNRIKSVTLCGPGSALPAVYDPSFMTANPNVKLITAHLYPCGESRSPNSIYKLLDNKYINQAAENCKKLNVETSLHKSAYRIGECNNFYDEGGNVADRFASALWGIDFMFTVAQNNGRGINFHGGSRGFTPITIKKGETASPRPLYYAMLFFHQASQGSLLPITQEAAGNTKIYAVLQKDNKVAITIINKDPNNESKVKVSLNDNFKNGSLILLKSNSIFSKDSISLGGVAVNKSGKLPLKSSTNIPFSKNSFEVVLPKASAALIIANR